MPLIIISGPTATYKTKTAIALGLFLQERGISASIINFDSLLFYQELNIGTAKPTKEERAQVPHALIDIASITHPLNAADYCKLAHPYIDHCHRQKIVPLLVGGSGFYLRACIKGMYPSTASPPEVIARVQQLFQTSGISAIIAELQCHDPASVQRLHPNDHYRLMRALEHFYSTNSPFSAQAQLIPGPFDFTTPLYPHWQLLHCYLDLDKELHWQLMRERTGQMLQDGLLLEVEQLLAQGFSGREKPLQSIGYKEALTYLAAKGKENLSQLQEKIFLATRQLAKAQRTFFQKITPKHQYQPLQDNHKLQKDVFRFLTSYSSMSGIEHRDA